MIKRFLWHSRAAQETQQCRLVWYGFQCHLNANSRILRFSQVIQHKAPRGRKGLFMPLSCITTDSHRVDRHILYQRKVPSTSYSASEGLWSAKHNEVQNWNCPNFINITLCFISYHLCLPFETVRHHYLYRTPHCSFRVFWHFETKQEWKQVYFLALNLKA